MIHTHIFEYKTKKKSFKCRLKDVSHVHMHEIININKTCYTVSIYMKNGQEYNMYCENNIKEIAYSDAKKLYDKINLKLS